ncbi:MAG: hypothetical protein K0U68_05130 [Gammaproteobacteria bacterium]|nr:hypothetical protein [Gammaproteobacteria bacterium]
MIKQQIVSDSDIFNALKRGVTVVTGNTRLAGAIREDYELSAMNNGLNVWLTPDIFPWTIWLQRVWGEAIVSGASLPDELLLTPQQEQRIWEDIIAESFLDQPLQQLSGTVKRAQEAWQLIQSWQLSLDQSVFRYNPDSVAFWNWASTFEVRCSNKKWLSLASLPDQLTKCIQAGTLSTPSELILIGFDELTPQQIALLQSLIDSGCDIHWMQRAGKQSVATRIECTDARDEATTIARWVRQCLDENAESKIGIVVPELESHRTMLIQAFDEVLIPQALQPGNHSVARPYNISLGPAFSNQPVISTALKLLGLLQPTISLEDVGKLLRSPFIAGREEEASARALLDGRLRQNGELYLTLKTLRYHAMQSDKLYSCPVFASSLGSWI